MTYIIIAFRSRNQTLAFSQILSSYGIRCSVVNTPRQAATSCGISVKINLADHAKAKEILARRNFNGFAGFFLVSTNNNHTNVRPI